MFLVRDFKISPKKELHWRVWVFRLDSSNASNSIFAGAGCGEVSGNPILYVLVQVFCLKNC